MNQPNLIRKIDRQIIRQGFHTIAQVVIEYHDGRQEQKEILQSPQGVLILPVTDRGTIILTREHRHVHGEVYGVPMGRINEGEAPLVAAQRELAEETGFTATGWVQTSRHHNGPHEEGLNYFFLATGLTPGEKALEADEVIELSEMTFAEAFQLMAEDKIVELPSRGCIWAGYLHLHPNG